MIIYCNESLDKSIEDEDVEIHNEIYIYSDSGIFKKYKHHYYEININQNIQMYNYNNVDFIVQEKEDVMDKSKIITTIPYKHYIVKRKILKTYINDNIFWIREIDNDIFKRDYFITSIPIYDAFEEISLFHK